MSREHGTLLVVDDNDFNRDMLARRLERRGYTVHVAHGGQQALDMLARALVDLVLLDVMMPDIDGFTVLDTLRRTYTPTALPIIMATVKDQSADVVEALQRGANDYLTKPIDFPVALARIRMHLAHKRAEEALIQARNHAMEQAQQRATFLANMSHEIRTPMNGILGVTHLLRDTVLSPEQRDYTETITISAKALLAIINDILDFSKIEAGKLPLDRAPFKLHSVVEGVLDLLAPQAASKALELLATLAPDIPPVLEGDAGRLRQILINLVGNAIKFTTEGEVHVQFTALEVTPTSVYLRGAVRDTGIGLSPFEQQKIFQPFAQANAGTSQHYGGTGLGLAICQQLVELMGGEVGLSSAPHQGTTFWFTCRCEPSTDTAPSVEPGPLAAAHFLVVEDNDTLGTWLQQEMNAMGLHSDVARSRDDAVQRLQQHAAAGQPYNGLCIDLARPAVQGQEVLQALRDMPCGQQLPVIGLLAWGQPPPEFLLPPCYTLGKPLKRAALRHCLGRIVNQRPPLAPVSASLPSVPPLLPAPSQPEETARILLVEDHPVNQLLALRMLRRLGYDVDVANHGLEAIEALNRKPYDVILMDCQMPVMDGYAATRAIRQQDTPYRTLPIIAMTAVYAADEQQHLLDIGMNDYISKPVDRQYLQEVLQRWLPPAKRTQPPAKDHA